MDKVTYSFITNPGLKKNLPVWGANELNVHFTDRDERNEHEYNWKCPTCWEGASWDETEFYSEQEEMPVHNAVCVAEHEYIIKETETNTDQFNTLIKRVYQLTAYRQHECVETLTKSDEWWENMVNELGGPTTDAQNWLTQNVALTQLGVSYINPWEESATAGHVVYAYWETRVKNETWDNDVLIGTDRDGTRYVKFSLTSTMGDPTELLNDANRFYGKDAVAASIVGKEHADTCIVINDTNIKQNEEMLNKTNIIWKDAEDTRYSVEVLETYKHNKDYDIDEECGGELEVDQTANPRAYHGENSPYAVAVARVASNGHAVRALVTDNATGTVEQVVSLQIMDSMLPIIWEEWNNNDGDGGYSRMDFYHNIWGVLPTAEDIGDFTMVMSTFTSFTCDDEDLRAVAWDLSEGKDQHMPTRYEPFI